jgi:2-phospho-L-lactate/phosphoenolpyruvate guanylyltransferase
VRTAAILPVKRFGAAKQRLGADVADELRAALARAMVADVLDALARTPAIDLVIVVSSEASIARPTTDRGAILVADDVESGQSAAVLRGVARAVSEGIERVLCVPGDCPSVEPSELQELLREPAREREVVVIPDRHGTGTNGLLLTPPNLISPSFGEGSCERHLALARAAGVVARIARPASLLLDVDTGADLDALRERFAGTPASGARTRAALGQTIPLATTA